jgi:cold shock CspA family protein
MSSGLQVHFQNLERSDAVEADVRRHAEKLSEFCDRILACQVTVDRPHVHQRQGQLFQVLIDVTLPGHELVVNRAPEQTHQHENVHVAIRDAFDAMRRRIEDTVRKDRHLVKRHEEPASGRVTQIFPTADYGFLVTPEGREVYFHRHSVLEEAFDQLDIGSEVRFSEEAGDRGPQASSLRMVGPRHVQGQTTPAQA